MALIYDRGLPFPDDRVDPGTEAALRELPGETPQPEEAGPAETASASPEPELFAGHDVARRMLQKLLRDRRVGGRHTRIENAYLHHFSDGEKDLARLVADLLEREGIFMPKLNEGSYHISINPRRLRDVGQIVDGTWSGRAARWTRCRA